MIEMTDELLNKYLDCELDSETMNAVRSELRKNPEALNRFRALQSVDKNLRALPERHPAEGFTGRVMAQLTSPVRKSKAQRRFILIVSSVFLLLCIAIIVFVVFSLAPSAREINPGTDSMRFLTGFFDGLVKLVKELFGGNAVSAIGSLISVGIMISGYFFFENQRRLRQNGNA